MRAENEGASGFSEPMGACIVFYKFAYPPRTSMPRNESCKLFSAIRPQVLQYKAIR